MTLKEWLSLPAGEKTKVPFLKMPIAVKSSIVVLGGVWIAFILFLFMSSSSQPTEQSKPYDRFARFEEMVTTKQICVGMSEEQVSRSWGEPTRIHRTVTKGITSDHERKQLVYGSRYIYTEDGVVTSFQE